MRDVGNDKQRSNSLVPKPLTEVGRRLPGKDVLKQVVSLSGQSTRHTHDGWFSNKLGIEDTNPIVFFGKSVPLGPVPRHTW